MGNDDGLHTRNAESSQKVEQICFWGDAARYFSDRISTRRMARKILTRVSACRLLSKWRTPSNLFISTAPSKDMESKTAYRGDNSLRRQVVA